MAENENIINQPIKEHLSANEITALHYDVEVNQNYAYFHNHDKALNAVSVFDSNIFNYLVQVESIGVLNETPYVYEDGVYIRDDDGSILMTMIKKLIYPRLQRMSTIRRVYLLFVNDRWLKIGIDWFNRYPVEYIIFENAVYNAKTKEILDHSCTMHAINKIPYTYDPNKDYSCPKIEKFLDEALSPNAKEMFLEYAGYCMTTDTRQQKFLMFTGEGGTGKSIFINLVAHAVGYQNISSIDLKSLADNRFSSFNLFQKLLNVCADIDKGSLSDVANIKLLTGGDIIKGEPKGKEPIFFRNYAKLLFSANEIPRIKGENTCAFYRRLLVIPLNKKPDKVNPNLLNELLPEIEGFIHLCMDALNRMYERGEILESEESKNATYALRLFSDSVEAFLNDKTTKSKDGKILAKDLHSAYKDYCTENELQPLFKQNFFKACDAKGFSHADGRNIKGLTWKRPDFEIIGNSDELPFT